MLSSVTTKSVPISNSAVTYSPAPGSTGVIDNTEAYGINVQSGVLYATSSPVRGFYRVVISPLTGQYNITQIYDISSYYSGNSSTLNDSRNFAVAPDETIFWTQGATTILAVGGPFGTTVTDINPTNRGYIKHLALNSNGTILYYVTSGNAVIYTFRYSGGAWSAGASIAELYSLGIPTNVCPFGVAAGDGNVYTLFVRHQDYFTMQPVVLAVVSPQGTLISSITSGVATANARCQVTLSIGDNVLWILIANLYTQTMRVFKWVVGQPDCSLFLTRTGDNILFVVAAHPIDRSVYVFQSPLIKYVANY